MNSDSQIDEILAAELAEVDWFKVTDTHATDLGLAMGRFRDAVNDWQIHRAAMRTALGSTISIMTLTIVLIAFGASLGSVLTAIIVSQTLRVFYLLWKSDEARRYSTFAKQDAIITANSLPQETR